MATPDEIKLQKGAHLPKKSKQVVQKLLLIESLAAGTPSLPTGTTISPQLQNVAQNELMGTAGVTGTLAAAVPQQLLLLLLLLQEQLTGTQITAPTAQSAAQFTATSCRTNSYNDCCTRNCINL